ATSQHTNKPGQKITSTKQEEATPIQLGVMSEKQKKRSKLFKGTHYEKLYKVVDLVAKKGDVQLWGPISEAPLYNLPIGESLLKLGCNTDLVIIGSTKSKASHIIDIGTFLFTDYEITVEEVLKNSDLAPVQQGQDITVPRSGGVVSLNGHIVTAIDNGQSPLEKGERYLLFLKYEPLAETYRPFGHPMFDDTFLIHGDEVTQISRNPLPLGWKKSTAASAFLKEARNALTQPCQPGGFLR
ncbi:MAG TPA: hypothetical protein VK363_13610, partial [Pyrinomonadaceae bacterium]|nr:hypothetical protein [Pyrinomonadaceae bacterium]